MTRFTPDHWLRRWGGRTVLAGGSPWRLVRVKSPVSAIVDRAYRSDGVRINRPADAAVINALVGRGILHPRPDPRSGPHNVTVVVPAYGRPDALARCLRRLRGLDVIVVDDATPQPHQLRDIAVAAGARYLRLPENRGPAAARNAGLVEVSTALVAFVDSDCQAEPGWLDHLVPHFDDPRVAVVAPRVVSGAGDESALSRFERASAALDMGRHPALVRPGARLGFVPSATLVIRREVLWQRAFDDKLRLGEDVDLVWRLADQGHHVRYEPRAVVLHEPRGSVRQWAVRLFEYGTSAVELEARHPGRLSPLRASPWNLAALALLARRRPIAALGASSATAGLLARRLGGQGLGPDVAMRVVAVGMVADALAVGHALRREYWPLGLLAAAAAPRSTAARVVLGLS